MSQLEGLDVVPFHSADDEDSHRIAEQWGSWYAWEVARGDMEDPRTGLQPEPILSLLDKIGTAGDNPTIAGILFRAGLEKPTPSEYELREHDDTGSLGDNPTWSKALYAVFTSSETRPYLGEPDALVFIEGEGRKPYRAYEDIWVNTWVNKDKQTQRGEAGVVDELELTRQTLKQIITNHPQRYLYDFFVDQDTLVHLVGNDDPRLGGTNGTSLEDFGIRPEDYADPNAHGPRDRLARVENDDTYEHAELLGAFGKLFKVLNLDVEEIDMEGGEHYSDTFDETEVEELKRRTSFLEDRDEITGVSLDREDRPRDSIHYDWKDGGSYRSNCWGDMTMCLTLQKGPVATTYTLVVDMDCYEDADLSKYTTKAHEHDSLLGRKAAHMLAASDAADPEEADTNLNDIDEFEYNNLVKLVRVMGEVIAEQ